MAAGGEPGECSAGLLLGGRLNVEHVGLDDRQRVLLYQEAQVALALAVRRHLRGNVGQSVLDAARGILAREE